MDLAAHIVNTTMRASLLTRPGANRYIYRMDDHERLRRWRDWAGMTQDQLATQVGRLTKNRRMDRRWISIWERTGTMSVAQSRAVATALGVDLSIYFNDRELELRETAARREHRVQHAGR